MDVSRNEMAPFADTMDQRWAEIIETGEYVINENARVAPVAKPAQFLINADAVKHGIHTAGDQDCPHVEGCVCLCVFEQLIETIFEGMQNMLLVMPSKQAKGTFRARVNRAIYDATFQENFRREAASAGVRGEE